MMIGNLEPSKIEKYNLPSGTRYSIPVYEFVFEPWRKKGKINTYGGKDILDLDGEPVFAEIALLRLIESFGWSGVWVDTFSNKYRISNNEEIALDPSKEKILNSIYDRSGTRSGCFDIFAWKSEILLFAEAKKKSKDNIRSTQLKWLDSARKQDHHSINFLIAEWTIKDNK